MFNFRKAKLVKKYNSRRIKVNRDSFCNAPMTSLRFHRNGGVQFCCHHIDFQFLDGKTIKEIWFGAEFNKIRKKMSKFDIPESCNFCSSAFYSNSFSNIGALAFDYLERDLEGYPVLMDFSLENTCNLSCIMCDASLSSSIQKDRGLKVAKTKNYYDNNFIEQLDEFIPHLRVAVFTGGEPFLINAYYPLWEKMIRLNPKMIINITTNGTVFNEKIINILEKGRFNITVSLDSLRADVYNKIRVNADFDKTYQNVLKFAEYCKQKGTVFTITVCPMQINKVDIPHILQKCNENEWNMTFNVVLKPWKQALWSLEPRDLTELISDYRKLKFENIDDISKSNINNFESFVNLLRIWEIKANIFKKKLLAGNEILRLRSEIEKKLISIIEKDCIDNQIIADKITLVVDAIPDILIKEELLEYINKTNPNMLMKELNANDADTIVDHLCIVAFNL